MKVQTFKCEGKIGASKGVTLARSAAPLIRAIRRMPHPTRGILITLRCPVETKRFIQQAAKLSNMSVSRFVLHAAIKQIRECGATFEEQCHATEKC
jgi:Protein of unknown function (DUF1778)